MRPAEEISVESPEFHRQQCNSEKNYDVFTITDNQENRLMVFIIIQSNKICRNPLIYLLCKRL